ncbi:MAG TPA: molybdate ABC transporter substrate-binding protein [Mycobacteriales bacterium]|nr:molybdate ABC transporter substrate-binding protein [Mycobacteriales bacterium]
MRRLLLVLLLVSGCGARGTSDTTVTVFAAASLRAAFTAEAEAFEREHPGTHVALSFAGSQSLAAQVQQGAPADVLATADLATIARVRGDLRGDPEVFAHNQLAIVTAPGNPEQVTSLSDLDRPGLRVVLAAPSVPVGKAAVAVLAAAGISVQPVSLEDSVSGVVGKVRLGEADAGIAYVTDLGHAVAGAPLAGTRTDLAIAALTEGGEPFVAFVRSPAGQQILRDHAFL